MKARLFLFLLFLFFVVVVIFIISQTLNRSTQKTIPARYVDTQKVAPIPGNPTFSQIKVPVFVSSESLPNTAKGLNVYNYKYDLGLFDRIKSFANKLGFPLQPTEISKGIWDFKLGYSLLTYDDNTKNISYTSNYEGTENPALFKDAQAIITSLSGAGFLPNYIKVETRARPKSLDKSEGGEALGELSFYDLEYLIDGETRLIFNTVSYSAGLIHVADGFGVTSFTARIPPQSITPVAAVTVFNKEELFAVLNAGRGSLVSVETLGKNTYDNYPNFNEIKIDKTELYLLLSPDEATILPVYRVVGTSTGLNKQRAEYFVRAYQ